MIIDKLRGRTPGTMGYGEQKQYAVAAPLLPGSKELLFEVRSPKLHRQPGEICFPGGRIESGETPDAAALRETGEELLVAGEQMDIVAPLDILMSPYHTVIYPYLIELRDYRGTFSEAEVAEVFSVPLSFFVTSEPEVYHNRIQVAPIDEAAFPYHLLGSDRSYRWSEATYPILFYQWQDKVIWGLTARIVQHLAELLREQGREERA